jgi:hypothetical protein
MENLPHFLGSFRSIWSTPQSRCNRGLAITVNAAAIPEIDERVRFKQMIRTSVNIPMKKEHSQLYYSLPAAKCPEISPQRSKTVHLQKIEDGAKPSRPEKAS